MKPAIAILVFVAVLGVASGAAFLVVGGTATDDPVVPGAVQTKPMARSTPVESLGEDPAPVAPRPVRPPTPEGPPSKAKLPDPGPEPTLPEERTPGVGQTFSTQFLADQSALADWKHAGLAARRTILAAVKYAAAARRGDRDLDTLHGAVAQEQQAATQSMAKLCFVLSAFETNSTMMATLAHPVVQGNLAAATLEAMNHPLTPEQIKLLQPIVDAGVAAERDLRQSVSASGWILDRELARGDHRTAFRESFEAVLTEDQRLLLSPPDIRDRLGLDIFCGHGFWDGRYDEVDADDPPFNLGDRMMSVLIAPANPPRGIFDKVRPWFVEDMTARIKRWPTVPNDMLTRRRHPPVAYIVACARELLVIGKEFEATGLLPEANMKLMRTNVQGVLVPSYMAR